MRPDKVGTHHQKQAVEGYSPGECPSRARWVLVGHRQKDWASSQRIDDREQRTYCEQEYFDRVGHKGSPENCSNVEMYRRLTAIHYQRRRERRGRCPREPGLGPQCCGSSQSRGWSAILMR